MSADELIYLLNPLAAPLYRRLYDILKNQIQGGHFRTGQLILGEVKMAQLLGVSRMTVKNSLNLLAREGLVKRRRGIGTIVVFDSGNSPSRLI